MPTVRNVIIIGSGPAGLTAALYTARANLQPLVIEGLEAGGQLMLTTMVENFPGHKDGIMGPDLMAEMRAQAEKFGAEIVQDHVGRVDLCAQPMTVKTSRRSTRRGRIIIATGASARLLGLPSERTLMGHGVSTCATCDGYFFRGQRDRGRRRRRLGDGGSRVPHALRVQGDGRAPPRHAARVEDHAGQGAREPEDRVAARQRGRGHSGQRRGRSHRDGRARQQDRRCGRRFR